MEGFIDCNSTWYGGWKRMRIIEFTDKNEIWEGLQGH